MSLLASFLILNSLHGPLATLPPGHALPADSIGQEVRGGQRFVRHRIAQGETMFALSRRYHVTVDQITAANPQLKAGLGIGEVVLIPRPGGAAAKTAALPAKPAAAPAVVPARYTVAKGETLFGIARRFGLSPTELMQLNHLPAGSPVRVGQELQLRAAEDGAVAPAAPPVAARPAAPEAAAPAPRLTLLRRRRLPP
ncbi:LysM peptidoglycan-binding domain-containing protein [Hymenobacter sp. BRD67]|uniref:LysM peptidoglycan-binding domain-containing protein n=1 Tax=Hymenobacter sp. BRD67 TaxID=2675877 RepID=UPI00156455C1|nr:LysM domain-containing protein [Hymenobacter sp. BRD67]QKG52901.1 LysM peptidoglycan-binding domain-containing protein [Hymenobacter sp. BRD67]